MFLIFTKELKIDLKTGNGINSPSSWPLIQNFLLQNTFFIFTYFDLFWPLCTYLDISWPNLISLYQIPGMSYSRLYCLLGILKSPAFTKKYAKILKSPQIVSRGGLNFYIVHNSPKSHTFGTVDHPVRKME